MLAIDADWHFAALETTLKQKPPATTNTICCQSQQRVNRPTVWDKSYARRSFRSKSFMAATAKWWSSSRPKGEGLCYVAI